MSRNNRIETGNQGAPRLGYHEYGINKRHLLELQQGCQTGQFSPETLSKACEGFRFIEPWIILSVTKSKSYDLIEFDFKLGRIPIGRSDFYGFRRKFYHNLDVILREECSA